MIPESTISRDDFFSVLLPNKKNCGSGDGRFELDSVFLRFDPLPPRVN